MHGTSFNVAEQVDQLALMNSTGETVSAGQRPLLDTAPKVAEMILHLSGVSNGAVAKEGFINQGTRVGSDMSDLYADVEGSHINWDMVKERPAEVITSPEWSGSKKNARRYTAFSINIEYDKPWHTLTGRQTFYLDHDWMTELGESLPVYRPPLSMAALFGESEVGDVGAFGVTVRYLTPHNKWSCLLYTSPSPRD